MATCLNVDLKAVELCFTIKNIQNVNTYQSNTVYIRGLPWMINLLKLRKKNAAGIEVESIFIGLNLKTDEIECKGAVVAKASIKIIPFITNQMPHQLEIGPRIFDSKLRRWGKILLAMTWNELMDTSIGYVSNDSLIFEAKIEVGPYQDDIISDSIEMETIEKCCNNGPEKTFRLTVKKFHQFMGVCSPKFILRSIPWRISIFKTQNNDVQHVDRVTNYLGIDLCHVIDISLKFPCETDLTIKLRSFDENIAPIERVIKRKQNRAVVALILWEDFINPINRFVENDSFVVEIDMKVERVEVNERKRKKSDFRNGDLECPICLENLIDRDISSTKCGHVFCNRCLDNLRICPCCNRIIVEKDLRSIYLPGTK